MLLRQTLASAATPASWLATASGSMRWSAVNGMEIRAAGSPCTEACSNGSNTCTHNKLEIIPNYDIVTLQWQCHSLLCHCVQQSVVYFRRTISTIKNQIPEDDRRIYLQNDRWQKKAIALCCCFHVRVALQHEDSGRAPAFTYPFNACLHSCNLPAVHSQ